MTKPPCLFLGQHYHLDCFFCESFKHSRFLMISYTVPLTIARHPSFSLFISSKTLDRSFSLSTPRLSKALIAPPSPSVSSASRRCSVPIQLCPSFLDSSRESCHTRFALGVQGRLTSTKSG